MTLLWMSNNCTLHSSITLCFFFIFVSCVNNSNIHRPSELTPEEMKYWLYRAVNNFPDFKKGRVVLISGFALQSQESMNTQLVNKIEPPSICSKRFVTTLVNQGTGNNSVHLNLAKEYIHKVVSCFIFLNSS